MAIAFDAASTGVVTGFNGAPGTTNITHVCTGSNLVLVLWVAVFQDTAPTGTVSAATYNGVSLTKVIPSFNSVAVAGEMWILAAPASGSHTLAVTVTGAVDGIRFEAASFTGVLQVSPLGATNTSTGSSGSPAVSITSATANSVLVSGLNRFANTATTATSWTNIARHNTTNVTTSFDYLVTTTAGAQTNTISGAVTQDWVMGAIELKPTTGGAVANGNFLAFM